MLKSAAKRALRAMARAVPWGAKEAILDGVLDGLGRFETFQRVGSELGVENISVRGGNGLVWGSIKDYWCLGMYATRGQHATQAINLFNQLFSKSDAGGTFLDIGANIGLTLFPVAQNSQVQCYGFEPEPRNFSYLSLGLQENCAHNNVVLQQLALFDRKDVVRFELSADNFGAHRVRMTEADGLLDEGSRATISVRCDRLDDVLPADRLRLPLGVKIDAEGAEPNIFAGGERTLAAADLISLEFAPYSMRRIGGDVEAELQFLRSKFREGTITYAESDDPPRWRPIVEIIDELTGYWCNTEIGLAYFNVTVRN